MVNYTTNAPGQQILRYVSINSVDVVNHSATGISKTGNLLPIDTSYYVGTVQVTPNVGDQWVITKQDGQWKLDHKLPFNDPNQAAVTPTQGQHVVGSGQGPVELNAGSSTVNVNSPLATQAVPSTGRPDPTTVPAGTQIYDTTLGIPIWSNGTVWTNALGEIPQASSTSDDISGGTP